MRIEKDAASAILSDSIGEFSKASVIRKAFLIIAFMCRAAAKRAKAPREINKPELTKGKKGDAVQSGLHQGESQGTQLFSR
jgi:hypothetical protein